MPDKDIYRVPVGGLRTLGADRTTAPPPVRTRDEALAEKARVLLKAEFERVLELKKKVADESAVGGAEKGRDALRRQEKMRGLIASLEGMNRFALQMGLITPAESRELYAAAMKRGLFEGTK